MTGFTHTHHTTCHWLLTSILSARQNSLASIYHSLVITCEYKSARQELLVSIFNTSAIACKQCTSRVARAQHASYLQIFSRHGALLVFFVNLDVSCTVKERILETSLDKKIINTLLNYMKWSYIRSIAWNMWPDLRKPGFHAQL